MRTLILAVLASVPLLQTGCFDGLAPPNLTIDGGADDLPVPLDGAGTPCKTACDCNAGDRCQAGFCTTSNVPVYCCGSATCPGSNLCQQADGRVDQCGLDPDAGFTPASDDAGTGPCVGQSCTPGIAGTVLCRLACGTSTADCVPGSGSGEHCMP